MTPVTTQERPVLNEDKPAGAFALGAVNVNPVLVYDIRPDDHVNHLRSTGYTRSKDIQYYHTEM